MPTYPEPDHPPFTRKTPLQIRIDKLKGNPKKREATAFYQEIAVTLRIPPALVKEVLDTATGIVAEEVAAGHPVTVPGLVTISRKRSSHTRTRSTLTLERVFHAHARLDTALIQLGKVAAWWRNAPWFQPTRANWRQYLKWDKATTLNPTRPDRPYPPSSPVPPPFHQ